MGVNMAVRLINDGHIVIGNARSKSTVDRAVEKGVLGAYTKEDLVSKLEPPRIIWLMVPTGATVDDTIRELIPILSPNDIIIDGGNSFYKDTLKRAKMLETNSINFLDVGTSGGIWGLSEGYSLMIGGDKDIVQKLEPIFKSLAPPDNKGWGRVGPNGAGHYVKMVHNGIEYGLMQAYAEGFNILKVKKGFDLDLHQISEIWRYGSVVRSWLLDLISIALSQDPNLSNIEPVVAESGEGYWTVLEALDQKISSPAITLSFLQRIHSQDKEHFVEKLLSAMREQFGGHPIKKKEKKL
jgi:6-phosphogluconate dehydrogenase